MKIIENGVIREMTPEEIEQEKNIENSMDTPEIRIQTLKQQLTATDYKAIKYAEGLISEEEYALIKAQRQAWRDEINALEQKICLKE